MSSEVSSDEKRELLDVGPDITARGRCASAWSVLTWAIRAGLVGGLAFGLVQTVVLGWRYRAMMGLRQWADALSYSGLAHGILWTLHGAVIGGACACLTLLSRRARRGIAPGPVGVAVLVAGATGFLLWPGAAVLGVPVAKGIHRTWCVVMAVYWLAATAVSYAIARGLATTWVGQSARRMARTAFWPAAIIVIASLAVQWFERPRLMNPTTAWRQSSVDALMRRDGRPNILLVVLDTQRVDRLGCYGCDRPTTPRLDAFAADALVFENCLSPAICTLPSHASIFTGLFPCEHGANYNHTWLDDGFTTMAELLLKDGYQTLALSNNVWISASSNLSQGFEEVLRPSALHQPRGNSVSEFLDRVLYPAGRVCRWLGAVTSEDAGAKTTNQLVARWLDRRDPNRPFFMFINYLEPHHPYRPHLPHRAVFVKPDDVDLSYRHEWSQGAEFSLLRRDCYTPAELQLLNETYDGETRMLDDYVGELLEVLAERVALDDTFVIITSDHGENLGDHHLMGHSWCVYDTLAHVPLIMSYPRRLRPGRTDRLVQLTDLLPTVMDAARGHPVPMPSTSGRSLLPPPSTRPGAPSTARSRLTSSAASKLASGPASQPADRVAVIERMAPRRGPIDRAQCIDVRFDRTPFEGVLRAIRQGPWKYVVAANGREELYHVVNDPAEVSNLIDAHRPIADRLAGRLRQWLSAAQIYKGSTRLNGHRPLDEETRRRLLDLGYLK